MLPWTYVIIEMIYEKELQKPNHRELEFKN